MPVTLQCSDVALSLDEVESLWAAVRTERGHADELVTIRCVSAAESAELNTQFRHKETATNVLTFSYTNEEQQADAQSEHDVALCTEIVVREADELGIAIRDYTARVVVHALLHATGMDHEQSEEAAEAQAHTERSVLSSCGFAAEAL